MNLLLIGVLLALIAIAYQIGLRKSRSLAGKGNNTAILHSPENQADDRGTLPGTEASNEEQDAAYGLRRGALSEHI